MTAELMTKYKKSHYRVIGNHSGVSVCRWTKSALRGNRHCYKQEWFGIKSHRCLQLTPSLQFCNFACQFCWRFHDVNRFKLNTEWDDPKFILDEAIKAQRVLLSGFGGNEKTSKEMFKEAVKPTNVAISLDGEPTLYPKLAEFIREIKSRKMTAFLVTNGTVPDRLKELIEKNAEPTNLYISVYGTSEEDYQKVCKPSIPNVFEKVKESLKLMREFKEARTIFRITAVKNLTMNNPEGYSELIKMSEPQFVEIKGYAWLGESRQRLTKEAIPTMEELEVFVNDIAKNSGYVIKARDDVSRVVLLSRD